jgi:predicted nucleic acid-binding protein
MATDAFFDTNVLVYLAVSEPAKARRARESLANGGVISVQVLNEFISVVRRRHALGWEEIRELLAGFRNRFGVEPLRQATQERAIEIAEAYRLDIHDATIVASAEHAGCTTLFTEDMQDGQVIAGLTIRDPLAGALS